MLNSYYSEDVQKILQKAMGMKAQREVFSREQLLDMAKELEISPETLQVAEKQYMQERKERQLREAFKAHRRKKFKEHLFTYFAVNTFLVVLDVADNRNLDWVYWVLLGWGIGLFFDARRAYQTSAQEYEKEFQEWRSQQSTEGLSG